MVADGTFCEKLFDGLDEENESPPDWLVLYEAESWQDNGHRISSVAFAYAELFLASGAEFQAEWGGALSKLVSLEEVCKSASIMDAPFTSKEQRECTLWFAFSDESVRSIDAHFNRLDLADLKPLYDQHVTNNREDIEDWGGYESAFLSVMEEWKKLFAQAAGMGMGLIAIVS